MLTPNGGEDNTDPYFLTLIQKFIFDTLEKYSHDSSVGFLFLSRTQKNTKMTTAKHKRAIFIYPKTTEYSGDEVPNHNRGLSEKFFLITDISEGVASTSFCTLARSGSI